MKEKKNIRKKKKKKKKERIAQIKNSGDAEVTLDPGRYHPNYNFIKRRYPCAYLGKPKEKEDSFHKDIKSFMEEDDEEKKISDKNNTNNNENTNSNDNENSSNRNTKSGNNKTSSSNRKVNLKTLNKKKVMNFSSSNFYLMPKSISNKNINKKLKKIHEVKKNKINLINEHNTISSWSHSMNLEIK